LTAGAFLVALGLGGAARSDEPPQGEIRAYLSAVDGSRQEYGVYVPRANPPSDSGYPVVMHAHGYGWWVGAGFSTWQRQWADDHGWVLVNVNGRGPNFYDGIGEDDVLRVLEDVAGLVAVDRSRVLITGGSMGGTGAYRMGVRRPDVFTGAAPVDGWTDYREFHRHWYERKDMHGSIEEFRRPLLEAVSPLYMAPTARWGDVQLVVDGEDSVVLPENGLGLTTALQDERGGAPEAYRHELVYYYNRGHGGGYDLRRIYEHFLGVAGPERPSSVTIQATLLRYGKVHWASIDGFQMQGAAGRLDAEVVDSAVHVSGCNLDAFSLCLPDSPLAGRDSVTVIVEGVPCYEGPPVEVSFEAERNGTGALVAWRRADPEAGRLRKRRSLEGPIGEAFLAPFAVVWGTAGDGTAARQGQIEAEDFAREWNAFNVHYEAVRARPEDELTDDERRTRNLVVFGTLDSSSLLRQMKSACDLPVKVYGERVVVRDPVNGDRAYEGAKYGAYWVYPNPLTGFTTLVVGCKGRFATKADGGVPRGLGYDLEKLQWAWGDYVVLDTDCQELPYVENVNDKPPVLAYEAGYFVEAGFFDQRWQPNRALELDRVRATRPDGSRLVHVDSVAPVPAGGARPGGVAVRIVDEGGGPVRQARVTLSWSEGGGTYSRPTDDAGLALFPTPQVADLGAATATVVNVCGTAATYSWPDDRQRMAVLVPGDAVGIEVAVLPERAGTYTGGAVPLAISVRNDGLQPVGVIIRAPGGPGSTSPATQELSVAGKGTGEARFVWDAADLAPSEYPIEFTATAEAGDGRKLARTARSVLTVLPELTLDADVVSVSAPDRRLGEPFEVVAQIENRDLFREIVVSARCVIAEARRFLPTQSVRIGPRGKATVRWQPAPGSRPLETGEYTATVSLADVPGAVGQASFVVK